MQLDVIWTLIGFILTLLIFSYVLGDNPLFRFASYLFIGVTAGYVAALIIYQVLIPKLLWPILVGSTGEKVLAGVAILLSLLLIARLFPVVSRLGNLPLAYLVGSGAAVIIGGAVLGTLFPQASATANAFRLTSASAGGAGLQLLEALVILVGTISTLAYFHFSARVRPAQPAARHPLIGSLAGVGQIFIGITLGSLFAGVLAASLAALIERLSFLLNFIF
jgi:hypothetical protein